MIVARLVSEIHIRIRFCFTVHYHYSAAQQYMIERPIGTNLFKISKYCDHILYLNFILFWNYA